MFVETRLILDQLARLLGQKPCFFYSLEEDETTLSALDILAYAYLKFMIANTGESNEVDLLRRSEAHT